MSHEDQIQETQRLRDRLRRLELALNHVVERNECYSTERGREPCGSCTWCVAKSALEEKTPTFDWRYRGARHERVTNGYHPRERRMIHAFAENVRDHELSRILGRDNVPTAIEWYVASTIVQWLATNVGMSVLRQAGFEYVKRKEDEK